MTGRHGKASRLPGATAGVIIAAVAAALAIVGTAVLMALVSS